MAAPLLAAELLVAILGLAPTVGRFHRAGVNDVTSDCWLPVHYPPVPDSDIIELARLPAATACIMLPKGWEPPDDWGIWSHGREATLDVPTRAGDRRVTLRLAAMAGPLPQRVDWVAGDDRGTLGIPGGQSAMLALDLPVPPPPMLQITLHIARIHDPLDTDFVDWRPIGVALLAIERSK